MYYINRNGQQYGPYSEETVRQYLAQGSLLPSDSARGEGSASWQPLGQLLQLGPSAGRDFAASGPTPVVPTVVPPSLHWAIVLLLSFTWIFPIAWAFVQSTWVRKIDPRSKATIFYALWTVCNVIVMICYAAAMVGMANNDRQLFQTMLAAEMLLSIPAAVLFWIGTFSIRRSMLTYYNTTEPISLRLSAVMTFFFAMLYLQYHMSRIARWKQTGVLSA